MRGSRITPVNRLKIYIFEMSSPDVSFVLNRRESTFTMTALSSHNPRNPPVIDINMRRGGRGMDTSNNGRARYTIIDILPRYVMNNISPILSLKILPSLISWLA